MKKLSKNALLDAVDRYILAVSRNLGKLSQESIAHSAIDFKLNLLSVIELMLLDYNKVYSRLCDLKELMLSDEIEFLLDDEHICVDLKGGRDIKKLIEIDKVDAEKDSKHICEIAVFSYIVLSVGANLNEVIDRMHNIWEELLKDETFNIK